MGRVDGYHAPNNRNDAALSWTNVIEDSPHSSLQEDKPGTTG